MVARVSASPSATWLFGKNRFDGPWTGYGVAVAGGSSFPWPHLGIGGAGPAQNGYVQLDTPIRDNFALVEIGCDGQRLRSAVNGRRTVRGVAGSIQANERNLLIGAGAQATGGAQFLDGEIAELLLYNRALKSAELEQTRQYLAAKYSMELTKEDAPEQMVILERRHLPVIVENPVTPKTSTLPEHRCLQASRRRVHRDRQAV